MRFAFLSLLAACALLFFLLHRHFVLLGEVAYTYAVFPNIKHRLHYIDFPLSEGDLLLTERPELVPRIIHQIQLSPSAGSAAHASLKHRDVSCESLHRNWTMMLWTEPEALDFVGTHYPSLLHHFVHYKQTIQRANILRYLLLHHYGGVYLDLDLICREPLDVFLTLPWLSPGAYPTGVNNAFIVAMPNHPFLTFLISRVASHDVNFLLPYVTNMLSTGCMFLSAAYTAFPKDQLYILGGGTKHYLKGHVTTPLFEHMGASSWHSWDAWFILGIGQGRLVVILPLIGLIVLLYTFVRAKAFNF